jgi:hypothetical protein
MTANPSLERTSTGHSAQTSYVLNTHPRRGFKYRTGDSATFERDLESLRGDYFYAALRTSLNDPFEGRFDRSALDEQFGAFGSLLQGDQPTLDASIANLSHAAEEVLSFIDKCGILSLSQAPLSELVWAHYGGSHHGFCVEYDIAKLVEFEMTQYHCIDVKYSNASPVFSAVDLVAGDALLPILQKMLGTKSSTWQYESEVRVITSVAGPHQYDFRAVKAIYFGLRCPEATRSRLMEALAGRGIRYKQIVSPASSYLLAASDLADPFRDAPRYRERLAPIAEGAIYPDSLKREQKQYASYLLKAAEIVRREPYCEEIQLVDFSGSKSTPERPVIFVQYKRAANRSFNQYLTLPEIEEQYRCLNGNSKDI